MFSVFVSISDLDLGVVQGPAMMSNSKKGLNLLRHLAFSVSRDNIPQ